MKCFLCDGSGRGIYAVMMKCNECNGTGLPKWDTKTMSFPENHNDIEWRNPAILINNFKFQLNDKTELEEGANLIGINPRSIVACGKCCGTGKNSVKVMTVCSKCNGSGQM